MSESLKTLLETCTLPEHFKSLFKQHLELVKEHPSLVFKRLESAQQFNNNFYTDLQDEVLILLEAMPMAVPQTLSASRDLDLPVRSLAEVEKEHILYATRYYDFDILKTAAALGISDRCLKDKLNLYLGKRTREPTGTLRVLLLNYLNQH
jgi:DNA-binding NtrC family response regulator